MTTLNPSIKLALLKRKNAKSALAKGFTLIELVVVLAIIGVLALIVFPKVSNQTTSAKDNAGNIWASANARACAVAQLTGVSTDFVAQKGPNASATATAPTCTIGSSNTFTGDGPTASNAITYTVSDSGDISK